MFIFIIFEMAENITLESQIMKYFLSLLIIGCLWVTKMNLQAQETNNEFLHASGTKIVDKDGSEFILRGIGFGNYMLVEPYMWGINNAKSKKSDTQQAILSSLAQLTGWDNVNTFMDEYRKNYVAETDIKMLKEAGFNSIRLPMHYNLFIEENATNNAIREKGFAMIDELLQWCKKYEIYLILDMHAVPGGQSTDKAISDQYSPGLWDGDSKGTPGQYQTKLIILWKEIAKRYGNEKWIGGYDLINEIMYYPSRGLAPEIRNLYQRITIAIREVDPNHILFIEGNGYANDFAELFPPWDNNMAYSFHRYWCGNKQSDIQYILNLRDIYKLPIWMGESGENSNTWFTSAIELLENNKTGWAWWAYKKVSNISGIVSIPRPDGWDKILNYLESSTDNSASLGLNAENTKAILMELAQNTRLERSKINKDVIYSMIKQPYNNNTLPYGNNILPGKLYATEYDLGRNGFAYNEKGILSRESSSDGSYNEGWLGRNDAVDAETCTDPGSNGFNIGWTQSGEWLNYTVNAQQKGDYNLKIRYSVGTSSSGNVTVKLNGVTVINNFSLSSTGGWSNYRLGDLGKITMNQGTNVIQIYINTGFNFSYLTFDYIENSTGIFSLKNESFCFNGIFPNPVVSSTSVRYTLPYEVDKVTFRIYNLQGALLNVIHAKETQKGENRMEYFNNFTSGVYQIQMCVEKGNQMIYKAFSKMIVK